MKEPLAFRLRPRRLQDIIGQQHLVGKDGLITRLVENEQIFSLIFFGPPGVGKTTLARVIAEELHRPYRSFNAVTGSKKDLDAVFFEAKMSGPLVLICDEVHRLNKDKQDLLLPHLEDGSVILLGATTANPYHAINPAIRSRAHMIELKALTPADIRDALQRALAAPEGLNGEYTIEESALQRIIDTVNGDIRYALNILEISAVYAKDGLISEEIVKEYTRVSNSRSFGSEDGYYDLLSAFQKSIRGSDPNAALYYLSQLAQAGEEEAILRRLQVIAYEEVGLANPALCARTASVCSTVREVGFPEAIIPLGVHVIDLCLSAKSRTASSAAEHVRELAKSHAYEMPRYLRLTPVGLAPEEQYSYERTDCFHRIQYLPDEIRDLDLFPSFAGNRYEQQLQQVYKELKKIGRTSDLKKLYGGN